MRPRSQVSDSPHADSGEELPRIGGFGLFEMIGASRAFSETMRRIGKIARYSAPVLIEGETGSGKEVAARSIHYLSERRDRPFIPVNCGAIPDALVESEFFGHARGAFTDARVARQGVIGEANGGTLFLDEVDALAPRAQVALLRFLQDMRYRPVGRNVEIAADVRLIAASNQPLSDLCARSRFRSDLLFRLNILYLRIPPLRERLDDAELLAKHFVAAFSAKYAIGPKRLHPDAIEWIRRHSWPGNVRELENVLHREFLLEDGDVLRLGHGDLADGGSTPPANGPGGGLGFQTAKKRAIREFERGFLTEAMRASHGNITAAAKLAGQERRAFGKLLRKHGIDRRVFV